MPTYLCHGFRWQRRSVRVYVVVQNLDDASPEWIIPAKSATCILESFYNLFDFLPYCAPSGRSAQSPIDSDEESFVFHTAASSNSRSRSQSVAAQSHRSRSQSQSQSHRSRSRSRQPSLGTKSRQQSSAQLAETGHGGSADVDFNAQDWSVVKVLEEYDPLNLTEVSRPYVYVADYVVQVDLSVSIVEEMQRYEERIRADRDPAMTGHGSDETGRKKNPKRQGWFEKLRDQLQRGEDIRWYVVVNGDEIREWPDEPPERRPEPLRRPTPTREQKQHHAQYMHQQLIFEGGDQKKGPGQVSRSRTGEWKPVPPVPPEKELPTIRPKMSMDGGSLMRPKTPSKGGLRRLFGRTNKAEETYYSP